MKWKEAIFKGKKVWVEVNSAGQVKMQQGRVGMRYSNHENAKVYRAFAANIEISDGAVVESASSSSRSGLGSSKTRTEAQKQQARSRTKNLLEEFSADTVVCFTDGACRGNPGPSGAGVVMKLPTGEVHTKGVFLGQGTNNTAELSALEIALDMMSEHGVDGQAPAALLTDSKYAHGVLSLGWKAKANRELILRIRAKIKNWGNLRFYWVAGHAGIPENEQADELATIAISSR